MQLGDVLLGLLLALLQKAVLSLRENTYDRPVTV